MRVLVVGGGGREHALCWCLSQSPGVERILAAPGNAGMAEVATLVPVPATELEGLIEVVERESIDLTVVGPEAPLVAGLADELTARGLLVFGPNRKAARIEGSKAWAAKLCARYGIPAPWSRTFDEFEPAADFLQEVEPPFVIKVDGLAGGKGVTVTEDRARAVGAVRNAVNRRAFGHAGRRVVIQEYLDGYEVSAMALTDGTTVLPLALAQDYKRAFDGHRGPNTGGMGAFSPVPAVGGEEETDIAHAILAATGKALEAEGIKYRGVLYAGLMMTADGPKALEFNCRFGDPEAQVVLPRLGSNLLDLVLACAQDNLSDHRLIWSADSCVGVVVASAGYPGRFETGRSISGLEEASRMAGVRVFHSGTAERDGRVITAGGRVLTVTATGDGHNRARQRAYEACSSIRFEGMTYRRDIAMGLEGGAG